MPASHGPALFFRMTGSMQRRLSPSAPSRPIPSMLRSFACLLNLTLATACARVRGLWWTKSPPSRAENSGNAWAACPMRTFFGSIGRRSCFSGWRAESRPRSSDLQSQCFKQFGAGSAMIGHGGAMAPGNGKQTSTGVSAACRRGPNGGNLFGRRRGRDRAQSEIVNRPEIVVAGRER